MTVPAGAAGVEVRTFGCRLNLVEGEAIAAAARGLNHPVDALVVNSCAVTAEAERQARQAIARAHRAAPDRRIIVTGCGAGTDPVRWASLPGVAAVLDNRAKDRPELLRAALAGRPVPAPDPAATPAPGPYRPLLSGPAHARAFVSVQTGCDHACTFCIIPTGRGRARSAPIDAVVALVGAAVAAGRQEVVLTGVDLASYGRDLGGGPLLGQLCRRLLAAHPGLRRLRLSSLDSVDVDPLLEALIVDEPRMMPHLHLSLQSGDPMILKRMRRRHRREEAVALAHRLRARRPGLTIGADLIAGFPTETDAMFAGTLALVADMPLTFGHVFPYSARAGTPAARMPQLPIPVVRERAAALRAAIAAATAAHCDAQRGATVRVLVENDGLTGHAEDFTPVTLSAPATPGAIVAARVVATCGRRLSASPLPERLAA